MFTYVITVILVAGICFVLGGAHERAKCEAFAIAQEQERQDAIVFDGYDVTDPVFRKGFQLDRPPHLRTVHLDSVDEHFDRLVRAGLIEPS